MIDLIKHRPDAHSKREVRALKQRYNYLIMLAQQNECEFSQTTTHARD